MVIAVFVVSRAAYAGFGVRFDDSAIHPSSWTQVQWQLLPTTLLRHDLIPSVWYLHSQPPLYNLLAGLLLHLPSGARQPVAAVVFLMLGLVMVMACYLLVVELGLGQLTAVVVAVLVTLDPATVLYENWLSWSYPTAAFMVVGFYGAVRLLRTGQARWAMLAASSFVCVVFLDSTYQWPWLAAIGVVIAVATRRSWKRVLAGAAVPLSLVLVWYVKDAVLFGTASTSSWLGMNLAQMTIYQAPTDQVSSLVGRHMLTRLAEIPPFAVPDLYSPRFVTVPRYGIRALDDKESDDGVANFNNLVYLYISPKYLHDSISYIVDEPGTYAGNVQRSIGVWMLPSDQYFAVAPNYRRIGGYARAFDAALLIQPTFAGPQTGVRAETIRQPPPLAGESWTLICAMLFLLFGAPVVLYRYRRADARSACIGLMLWLTIAYSFVVTSLIAIGENNRFRFELGPVLVVLLVLMVFGVWHEVRSCHASTGLFARPPDALPPGLGTSASIRRRARSLDTERPITLPVRLPGQIIGDLRSMSHPLRPTITSCALAPTMPPQVALVLVVASGCG